MAPTFQVTFDCRDIETMTRFWAVALEYDDEPPPAGFASWVDFANAHDIPSAQWRGALIDPAENGPRVFFQPVPEEKVAKNRVHLDINVSQHQSTPEEGRKVAMRHAARCENAGGTILDTFDEKLGWHIAMLDPEGTNSASNKWLTTRSITGAARRSPIDSP